jgi:hypothetical protein
MADRIVGQKYVLLMSGMLRNFVLTYPSIKRNILTKYSPEVFFYGYANRWGLTACTDIFLELYKPKGVIIKNVEDDLSIYTKHSIEGLESNKRPETQVTNFISMHYGRKQVFQLFKEQQVENENVMITVIYHRPDMWATRPFLRSELECALEPNNIVIPSAWNFSFIHSLSVSDIGAIGNNHTMSAYCSVLDKIQEYHSEGHMLHPESYNGIHLRRQGVNVINVEGKGWIDADGYHDGQCSRKLF